MRSPLSEVSYETKTLERLNVAAQEVVTKEMLTGMDGLELERFENHLMNSLIFRLKAFVWHDPERQRREVRKIEYTQAHPTWKHHLTASLPEGSFLRRWCHFFWDIPFDYANHRVTEEVVIDAKAIFPESTTKYPENLGRVHYAIQTGQDRYVEPYYER